MQLNTLLSAECPAGCSSMTGDKGFSARIMWRDEQMVSYSYYADMTESHCGENWYWDVATNSGTWHMIEMYLKTNTDGAHAFTVVPVLDREVCE